MPFAGSGNSCATGGPDRQEGPCVRLRGIGCGALKAEVTVQEDLSRALCRDRTGLQLDLQGAPCDWQTGNGFAGGSPEARGRAFESPSSRGFETASPPSWKRVMRV